jgi:nucleoside-diphosphate-sugar epimerase
MRVFVAGASGAIGTRLVPQLVDAGDGTLALATATATAGVIRLDQGRTAV